MIYYLAKKRHFLAAWVANQNSVFSSSCLVLDLAHNNKKYCKFGYELVVTHYFFWLNKTGIDVTSQN